MGKAMKKVLDTMAAICLLFNVDWDEDFGDDEIAVQMREENQE